MQCFNPYLPNYEYVPDGEPHVFGDRIYVYGSHDLFNAYSFCQGDYVCWSCPVNNVKEWRYEGVIWRRTDDPRNTRGRKPMYAPDVCKGVDGRYYLYYFLGYTGRIGVAVCDTPCGKYEFLDYVHYSDGTLLGSKKGDIFQFDPGVYTEGEKTYLYTGFCPVNYPFFLTGGKPISKKGPTVTVLGKDMVTIEEPPKFIGVECKVSGKGTPYEGHEFFEAASMRKIGDKYYFIYSSFLGHELCYATSDRPDGEFAFGGTVISIGDVGLRGIKGVKDAASACGNTHGSIARDAFGQYYIFYHRQTNKHCFSRQACAELITIESDGSIKQVEVTSQGLNGKPLTGKGEYSAAIACNLSHKKGGKFYSVFKHRNRPYLTQTGVDRNDNPDQYIEDITDGTLIGFKYFAFENAKSVAIEIKGKPNGTFTVSDGENAVAKIQVNGAGTFSAALDMCDGVHPLYFAYSGKGKCSLHTITLG